MGGDGAERARPGVAAGGGGQGLGRDWRRGPGAGPRTRREAHSPEPFAPETGHREHAPVDEDAELGLVEPSGQLSRVQGHPGGVEARGAAGRTLQGPQQQQQQQR